MIQTRTYSFFYYDDRLFELCKEAGKVYSASLKKFWETYEKDDKWLSKFDLQKEMIGVIERENLHSDSYLAAMQQVHNNLASWKEAKKINPDAKAPYKSKFLQPIFFKQSQIKYKKRHLVLTLDKNKNYIVIPWNESVPIPCFGQVGYSKITGWRISLTFEQDIKEIAIDENKGMSVDLGVKRIATLFDGNRVVALNGKKLKGLLHYRNKTNADYMSKLSRKKKGSNNKKKLQRGRRKTVARLRNIQNDIINKQSRFIVNYAINNNIKKITFGDNSGVHNKTNCGKNNQMIQQFPEQKLYKQVEYKFTSVSGVVERKPEPYTSQQCPLCGKKHKTNNRVYTCKQCKYTYDRDGVGAINIYKQNVSLVENQRIRLLTRPFGVKFKNNLSFKHYAKLLNVTEDYKFL